MVKKKRKRKKPTTSPHLAPLFIFYILPPDRSYQPAFLQLCLKCALPCPQFGFPDSASSVQNTLLWATVGHCSLLAKVCFPHQPPHQPRFNPIASLYAFLVPCTPSLDLLYCNHPTPCVIANLVAVLLKYKCCESGDLVGLIHYCIP